MTLLASFVVGCSSGDSGGGDGGAKIDTTLKPNKLPHAIAGGGGGGGATTGGTGSGAPQAQ